MSASGEIQETTGLYHTYSYIWRREAQVFQGEVTIAYVEFVGWKLPPYMIDPMIRQKLNITACGLTQKSGGLVVSEAAGENKISSP